jgi:hypothetical protein
LALPLVLRPGLAFPACTGLKQEVPYGTPLLPSQPSASLLAEIDNWLISADSLTYCLLKLMSQLSLHQNLKEQLSSSATLNSGFKTFFPCISLFSYFSEIAALILLTGCVTTWIRDGPLFFSRNCSRLKL